MRLRTYIIDHAENNHTLVDHATINIDVFISMEYYKASEIVWPSWWRRIKHFNHTSINCLPSFIFSAPCGVNPIKSPPLFNKAVIAS